MFKKTLIAAALMTATTAFAGEITILGDAYKVGNEYLGAYTGSALEGDLQAAQIGINYNAGIALGVDNTLKFEFTGGAIAANTGLVLVKGGDGDASAHEDEAIIEAHIDTALVNVSELSAGDGTDDANNTANLKAAAIAVINDAIAVDSTIEATAYIIAIDALADDTYDNTTAAINTAVRDAETIFSTIIPQISLPVADLVDFGVDANGDYQWVLFKVTDATLVTDVIFFNDTDLDGAANVVTKFTKATIGSGDLTVAMIEAKDSTSADLAAPIAEAEVLVTTANQFAVVLTVAEDTIDVEADRKAFTDNDKESSLETNDFGYSVTNDLTIDLGINAALADFTAEVTGNMTGVTSIAYDGDSEDSVDLDDNNEVTGTGIESATVAVTVDGETNLATRTLGFTMFISPAEESTDDFYLVGSTAATAFDWDLNGSEITFPYAPVGYDHITTNFEIANSGDQVGDVLITAFTRAGVDYSGTLVGKAAAQSLTKISEQEVYDALELPAGTSLSITFSTTAPDADIKISGYSNLNSGGRMALLSTAYEGKINPVNPVNPQ